MENRANLPEGVSPTRCPHFEQLTGMLAYAFERATDRGEWQGDYRAEEAYDMLNGQLLYRIIGRREVITEAAIDKLVSHMLVAAEV